MMDGVGGEWPTAIADVDEPMPCSMDIDSSSHGSNSSSPPPALSTDHRAALHIHTRPFDCIPTRSVGSCVPCHHEAQGLPDITLEVGHLHPTGWRIGGREQMGGLRPSRVYVGSWRYGRPHGLSGDLWDFDQMTFYRGAFRNGMREGEGVLLNKDGEEIYRGCFETDLPNGHGLGVMKCGYQWTGPWKDGQPHMSERGELKCRTTGFVQIGTFKDNQPHGDDIEQCHTDGTTLTGSFRDGKKHGQATFTWPEGRLQLQLRFDTDVLKEVVLERLAPDSLPQEVYRVQGDLQFLGKDGLFSGSGAQVFPNGDHFYTSFTKGIKQGRGTMMRYFCGAGESWWCCTYEGTFENDLFVRGEGTEMQKRDAGATLRRVYEGSVVRSGDGQMLRHGRGKLLIENGSEGHIVGEWEGGNLLSGADYDKNGQMVYHGSFRKVGDDIYWDGQGTTFYPDGSQHGVLTDSKQRIQGLWVDNSIHSGSRYSRLAMGGGFSSSPDYEGEFNHQTFAREGVGRELRDDGTILAAIFRDDRKKGVGFIATRGCETPQQVQWSDQKPRVLPPCSDACMSCYEEFHGESNHFVFPCGHAPLCATCLPKWESAQRRRSPTGRYDPCPYCQDPYPRAFLRTSFFEKLQKFALGLDLSLCLPPPSWDIDDDDDDLPPPRAHVGGGPQRGNNGNGANDGDGNNGPADDFFVDAVEDFDAAPV
ncbi:unnamed protein product [Vitrella brassicaformis CCMP3155]|uniref:RING-type domain-containing protein n=1 Tax=Vitrella brassicaformis (strain CCMP3155) TaxID=1169540 RepID=A0A0G4FTA9_VITBC|nr:unnamed protein product [Vitrella brassicaformis CCMP3155]|eukprot:CEM17866.1 unnamed protein product [Vitrella brassicaformis CCMP3155]